MAHLFALSSGVRGGAILPWRSHSKEFWWIGNGRDGTRLRAQHFGIYDVDGRAILVGDDLVEDVAELDGASIM